MACINFEVNISRVDEFRIVIRIKAIRRRGCWGEDSNRQRRKSPPTDTRPVQNAGLSVFYMSVNIQGLAGEAPVAIVGSPKNYQLKLRSICDGPFV
jgi:hypothetical protein